MYHSHAQYIGHVATFYLPVKKLDSSIRQLLHNFFMEHYAAYTHEKSNIHGYWMNQDILEQDEHERFEVSFKGNVKEFIDFLSHICYLINEKSIYLTMGYKSWLIKPLIKP